VETDNKGGRQAHTEGGWGPLVARGVSEAGMGVLDGVNHEVGSGRSASPLPLLARCPADVG